MPNDTLQTTPKSEVPGWVTETPHDIDYDLGMFHEGDQLERLDLSRAEFVSLKRHLAKMRGFDVPESEPETAPAEAAGAPDEPISGRLVGSMIEGIISDLKDHQDFIAYRGIKCTASDWSEFQADAALLKEIVADWTGDGYLDDFPKETKLIGTIRAHLDL